MNGRGWAKLDWEERLILACIAAATDLNLAVRAGDVNMLARAVASEEKAVVGISHRLEKLHHEQCEPPDNQLRLTAAAEAQLGQQARAGWQYARAKDYLAMVPEDFARRQVHLEAISWYWLERRTGHNKISRRQRRVQLVKALQLGGIDATEAWLEGIETVVAAKLRDLPPRRRHYEHRGEKKS